MNKLLFFFFFIPFFSCAQVFIQIDTSVQHQKITGWEVMGWMANSDTQWQIDNLHLWNDTVGELCADVGIDRIRIEVYSGSENPIDYFTQYIQGSITRQEWKDHWYDIQNDNVFPDTIDYAGFHFSNTIYNIEHVAMPLKNAVEADGREFYLNLCYVDFGASSFEHHEDPEEYAEFMLACFNTLYNYFGFVPDGIEVILEPENSSWGDGTNLEVGSRIADAIAAAGDTLAAHGYHPDFIAPSTTAASNAVPWSLPILMDSIAVNYLSEICYHKYWNQSSADLMEICSLANSHQINSSMLEWWQDGNDQDHLYRDLTLGCVSAWQNGIMAEVNIGYLNPNTNALYTIDDSDLSNPTVVENNNTRYFRQYFKYIPKYSQRLEVAPSPANHEVTAYKSPDALHVVVVNADNANTYAIAGLPGGKYGLSYSTETLNHFIDTASIISSGDTLSASIPDEGVLTIYQIPLDVSETTVLLENQSITLFPNPAHNYFTISGITENYTITIRDELGAVYATYLTNTDVVIDTTTLPTGLYFISIQNNSNANVLLKKIIKMD